ncbi:MAG TPA: tetratricopeptide repeat protein [Candidatus Acidoferrum sp.]|nr:tetratricopeptide repeat protein [Candidatus Acidoferrum sp.]
MRTQISRLMAVSMALLLLPAPDWATCGGGGGGGMGGMRSGGSGSMGDEQVYQVPWKLVKPDETPSAGGLLVYWFPSSAQEFQRSSLRNSRSLSLYASQCVTMGVADAGTSLGQKFLSGDKLPVVVLAKSDGTIINKIQNNNGFLKVDSVEKLVESEMKQREETIKQELKAAKEKAKSGDKDGAIPLYRSVLEEKCLFPGKAKDAAKELKKLGVDASVKLFDAPVMNPAQSARIEAAMKRGLQAEMSEKYEQAERLYSQARHMDPADPAPLRYLGELYRHHLGDWDKARVTFQAILDMPADPLSRAVALHGLGKMTIHEGEFLKGLHLMEDSVREYPLALAYRNLAVYWNSEGDNAKADYYTREATKIDPTDPYNLVFAAAFLAGNGHSDEALKIATENEAMLPASYNLAAIYAQLGQKQKALDLLKRHFFQYERYQAVRSKEMMEARVDAVFASLREDPQFIALTGAADGKLPIPQGKKMPVASPARM